MIRLIGIIVMALALAACGSGGGDDPKLSGDGVEITCMDAVAAATDACEGAEMTALGKLAAGPQTKIYNGGDVRLSEIVYMAFDAANYNATAAFHGIIIIPSYINGCAPGGWGYAPRDIAGGATLEEVYENDPPCWSAALGPQHFFVALYNGTTEAVEYFNKWAVPHWNDTAFTNNPAEPWDWGLVDAEMLDWGLTPEVRGRLFFNYVP